MGTIAIAPNYTTESHLSRIEPGIDQSRSICDDPAVLVTEVRCDALLADLTRDLAAGGGALSDRVRAPPTAGALQSRASQTVLPEGEKRGQKC